MANCIGGVEQALHMEARARLTAPPKFPYNERDTDRRLLAMNLTPADVADSTGAQFVLNLLVKRWPQVNHLFGDAVYHRRTLLAKVAYFDFTSR
jgi:hypothetical protein